MKTRRNRNRVLLWAFAFSVAFHLSMITVFRITVWFPRNDIEYFRMEIVENTALATSRSAAVERLELSSGAPDFGLPPADGAGGAAPDWMPKIELPTVEFAELKLLRLRSQSLGIRSRYEELFRPTHEDAWAEFGRRLRSMGEAVAGAVVGERAEEGPRLIAVARPAPGFEAYIEWMSPPYDREPMSAARVEALWGANPAQMIRPLSFVFKVNEKGRVTRVLSPLGPDSALIDGTSEALFTFRFAPVPGVDSQHGTYMLKAAEDAL